MQRLILSAAALLAVPFLASCSSEAQDAEDQFNIVARGGASPDSCIAAGKVAAAWLHTKDEMNYLHWKIREQKECMDADHMQADNLDALPDNTVTP